VFGRRAALAAAGEPPSRAEAEPADAEAAAKPSEATRAALWRHAGLRRDAAGLRELLADAYPLARMIGAACLAREESRGAHQRSDHPDTDRSLDLMHTLVEEDAAPRFERWQ
jgi:L-aspartate oxidase